MNAKGNAGNAIVMRSVGRRRDTKFVSVCTVLREMDGAVQVPNTFPFYTLVHYSVFYLALIRWTLDKTLNKTEFETTPLSLKSMFIEN